MIAPNPTEGETTPRPPVWRWLTLATLLLITGAVLRPVYLNFDAHHHGPYTRAFNRRCQRIAEQAHLIGRPEADVVAVLGKPSLLYEWLDRSGAHARTYNYAPSANHKGHFQVLCWNGIVRNLTQMND